MNTPPRIQSTAPCPVCGGTLTARRDKTAHRTMFVCDCGHREKLPVALRLRLMGHPQLPLFDKEEANV